MRSCNRSSDESPRPHIATYILLTKRSLFTPLPLLPLGFSVHISFTFSSTILQCRSKALTRAKSLRLFRHEIRTWVWVRVAVCRSDSGPAVSSCSSTRAISYSLMCGVRLVFFSASCMSAAHASECNKRGIVGRGHRQSRPKPRTSQNQAEIDRQGWKVNG